MTDYIIRRRVEWVRKDEPWLFFSGVILLTILLAFVIILLVFIAAQFIHPVLVWPILLGLGALWVFYKGYKQWKKDSV